MGPVIIPRNFTVILATITAPLFVQNFIVTLARPDTCQDEPDPLFGSGSTLSVRFGL